MVVGWREWEYRRSRVAAAMARIGDPAGQWDRDWLLVESGKTVEINFDADPKRWSGLVRGMIPDDPDQRPKICGQE